MPSEQKYSAEVRAAATARVVERRSKNPKDRRVFAEVAEEFSVGQQSLRGWVAKAMADEGKRPKPARRPNFSSVVTTVAQRGSGQEASDTGPAVPASNRSTTAGTSGSDVAFLEAEVSELCRGNDALKAAMRVLLHV